MPKKPARITLAIVLDHIQAMRGDLTSRIDRLGGRIGRVEVRLDCVETRLGRLEGKVDRMHVNLSNQIDALDKRLDDVEIVQVPKLKKAVGMR